MKSERSLKRETNSVYALWKDAEVGSARGWFLLGALFALAWMRGGVRSRASKFAEREWRRQDGRVVR